MWHKLNFHCANWELSFWCEMQDKLVLLSFQEKITLQGEGRTWKYSQGKLDQWKVCQRIRLYV